MTTRRATSLWQPATDTRAQRRARRRAERALPTTSTAADNAGHREPKRHRDRDEGERPCAGVRGERRRAALWTPQRLHVPAHRATTATVAWAYPMLTEGGLGGRGVLIGTDVHSATAFCFDPWQLYRAGVLTNPNVLVAGVIGMGKSALAKSLVVRSIAFGTKVVVAGDPKGEWSTVAHAVGGVAITLGDGHHRLNPLDAGPRPTTATSEAEWLSTVAMRRVSLLAAIAESTLGRPMTPVEHTALGAALAETVDATASAGRQRVPVIPDVVGALLEPASDRRLGTESRAQRVRDGRDIAHALHRLVAGDLAGLFDGPSTVAFDAQAPMVSVDLSRLGAGSSDAAMRLAMTCVGTWTSSALADPGGGHRWLVHDEAWRTMRDPALLRAHQASWKLARALGVANLIIVHRLSDLDAVGAAGSQARAMAEGLLSDCSTRIVLRQETEQLDRTGTLLGLTDVQRSAIAALPVGRALWRVGRRAHVVQHQLHPDEAALFDTSARMAATTSSTPGEPPGRP